MIDDESSIRLLANVNLTASGMEVLEAPDGAAGVEVARREQPDIVLLDVMMPDVDGWEVARQLAAEAILRAIPVCIIMLTAYSDEECRLRARNLGACGYVVKPVTTDSLLPELASAFEIYSKRAA